MAHKLGQCNLPNILFDRNRREYNDSSSNDPFLSWRSGDDAEVGGFVGERSCREFILSPVPLA